MATLSDSPRPLTCPFCEWKPRKQIRGVANRAKSVQMHIGHKHRGPNGEAPFWPLGPEGRDAPNTNDNLPIERLVDDGLEGLIQAMVDGFDVAIANAERLESEAQVWRDRADAIDDAIVRLQVAGQ